MNFLEYLLSRQLEFDHEGSPGTKYLICVFLPFPTRSGFVVDGAYTFGSTADFGSDTSVLLP